MSIVRKGPEDSNDKLVRISREEAIELQWRSIYDWKPRSEVWPFHIGIAALGLSAAASSLYIIGYYRRKLKLGKHAIVSMNAPVAALPAVLIPLLHQKIVSEPILVQTACPVCIQLRSMLLQCSVGVLYPMLLAPLTGFMYSSLFVTYPLPLLKMKNAPELFAIWRKITLPFGRRLPYLLGLHAFIAAFVTEFEARTFFSMQEKLISNVKKK